MLNIKGKQMFTAVTRRTGRIAHIELARSHNNPEMMFMSTPPVCELTEGQAVDLLAALDSMIEQMWPETSR